jgi:hypothetical protein
VQNINHDKIALEVAKQSLIYHHPEKYECHLFNVIHWSNTTGATSGALFVMIYGF